MEATRDPAPHRNMTKTVYTKQNFVFIFFFLLSTRPNHTQPKLNNHGVTRLSNHKGGPYGHDDLSKRFLQLCTPHLHPHPQNTSLLLHPLVSRSKPRPTLCETENRDRSTCCFCSHLNCTLLTHIRTHYDVFKTGEGGGGPKECVWAVEHALFLLPSLSSSSHHHQPHHSPPLRLWDAQQRWRPAGECFQFYNKALAKSGNSIHGKFQNPLPNKENYYNNPRVMFSRWYFAPRRQSWRTWGKWYAKYSRLEFFFVCLR